MQISFDHVGAFITGAISLAAVIRIVAPLTDTKKDDEAVAKIDAAEKWIDEKARVVWPIVEAAGKLGTLPAGVGKAIWFLEKIREEYRKAHDADLPKTLEALAMKTAAQLSQAEKLIR